MRKKIWGNTLVCNEDRYIWFAVMSVIDYLDKILIWDTGSQDNTVKIIRKMQKIKKDKIIFKQYGPVNKDSLTKARQEMLEQTKSDWLLMVDGDEVWWEDSIKKVISTIEQKGDRLDLLVNPFYSLVGDIYHHQDQLAGKYKLAGRKGHFNVRAVNRNIPGLHVDKPYGQEGFFDDQNKPIQNRPSSGISYVDAPYLHFSNLRRSTIFKADKTVMQRKAKIKHEIGLKFPDEYKYPEVLYKPKPAIVYDPWIKMSSTYKFRAFFETPLRTLKRRLT